MNLLSATLAGAVGLFAVAATTSGAHAVTSLGMFVNDYGTGAGKVDPGGNDVLGSDSVRISDDSTSRFFDSFDLSGLFGTFVPGFTIDRFDLTLTFDKAGPSLFPTEYWNVRVQGSNSSSALDDLFVPIFDPLSPQTVTISMGTDLLFIDAFAHSVASEKLEFGFSEFTPANGFFEKPDKFDLDSAKLEVFGEATVIPAPVALPMLASAFGLAAFVRRRTRRQAD